MCNVLARQENDDQYTTELEKLKYTLLRTEEEKKRLEDELAKVCKIQINCCYINE